MRQKIAPLLKKKTTSWRVGSPQAKKLPEMECNPTRQQIIRLKLDFPGSSVSKESACSARDPGLIPVWGRSPG